MDNAYLDIFLQNGLIGFLLFFIPLVILMRRTRFNAVSAADDHDSRQARIALGCWVGILVQMTTASVIPSFGNVINIFILVFMAPMALKIEPVQLTSGEQANSSLSPVRSIGEMSVNQAGGPIRIHQIHKLPTPYTDFFFQALQDNPNIDFHVYYLWQGSWRRPWKSELGLGYHHTFMKPIWGIDWRLLQTAWCDVDSFFIVGDWAHLPTVAVILARYLRRAPVALWVDTPVEDVKRPVLKQWLRRRFLRWLLPKPDIIFGTGRKARRVLLEMGARAEQFVDLPFWWIWIGLF